MSERRAPVQGYVQGIPWEMHLRAYNVYCKRYSPQQALIEGGCRGGFSTGELDMFIPGWREELSERKAMQDELALARSQVETLTRQLGEMKERCAKVCGDMAAKLANQAAHAADGEWACVFGYQEIAVEECETRIRALSDTQETAG